MLLCRGSLWRAQLKIILLGNWIFISAQQGCVGWLNRSNLEHHVSYYIWVFVYDVVKQLTAKVTNAPKSHVLQARQRKTPHNLKI